MPSTLLSLLIPTQDIDFLGFLLNSSSMTVRLSSRKATVVKQVRGRVGQPYYKGSCSDHRLLSFQVFLVQFGELHYRHLEGNKILALQAYVKHKYRGQTRIALMDFRNIMETKHPDLTLTTDVSIKGWGQSVKESRPEGFGVLKNNVPASII